MEEVWKPLSWTTKYMVSNTGKVKNIITDKQLNGSVSNRGYVRYDLCIDGKRIAKSGHRLVADAFLPIDEDRPYINHIDGNKTNNVLTNLERCSCKENSQHAFTVLGIKPATRKAVRCIETGKIYESACDAERDLNISNSEINRCCNGNRKSTHGLHFEFA